MPPGMSRGILMYWVWIFVRPSIATLSVLVVADFQPLRAAVANFGDLVFEWFQISARTTPNTTSMAKPITARISISTGGIGAVRRNWGGLAIPGTAAKVNAILAATKQLIVLVVFPSRRFGCRIIAELHALVVTTGIDQYGHHEEMVL